ncbi:glycoside hydrolase family 130 protein [Marinitoga litoralis]|uniref:glycoside hydrolase family 130 protein n=1 Tax=Marinitoga litoralis TaxID=570855 RepID=UPI0019606660|nr:glycoside hydrolase family 130 protein [Marinitoga litoralis]MBM7559167.1 beta-1,4-mannooligosaccharide/beta-1,4-mannosyl-N-acetylglucosamine phosphorylase [Marinitoga litoralis]
MIPWEDRKDNNEIIWRYSKNPITKRNQFKNGARIFNSAVLPYNNGFVGVFRVDHNNTVPNLHIGRSDDGINWEFDENVIEWIDKDGNISVPVYAYDPRLVKLDDYYYITFCTDLHGPTIGVGRTKDYIKFERLPDAFLPFNRNGVLFPRKINGKYYMLSRPSDNGHTPFGDIFISESNDLIHWGNHKWLMGRKNDSWWENLKIGAGPIPIETNEGWLLIYHGVTNTCNGYVYSFGTALLDLEDPSKVLYRSNNYLMTPEESYETVGFVPNVVFPCSALVKNDKIAIYYGAADTYIGIAFAYLNELIEFTKKNSKI